MKRILITALFVGLGMQCIFADVTLPKQCEAFLPEELTKSLLFEADLEKLVNSSDYGQKQSTSNKFYWDVYSDRTENKTYSNPSSSSDVYGTLNFRQPLRIAKIEKGYALVYEEPKKGVAYPLISSEAVSKGWVPMKNLLLWSSCPANSHGIYNKALIALNVDEIKRLRNGGSAKAIGKKYAAPNLNYEDGAIQTKMSFYFIMKTEGSGDNQMFLLADQYKLGGLTGFNNIYGWVRKTELVNWNQRSCIEPEYNSETVAKFVQNNVAVKIYIEDDLQNDINEWTYGFKFEENKKDLYRMPASILRYPILNTETDRKDVYRCTTFGTLDGELTELSSRRSKALKKQRQTIEDMKRLNLIVVIDGTRSMEKYFPAVKAAIREACNDYLSTEFYTPRVGIVIYRDYSDGEQGLYEYVPLSEPNDMRLNKFFDDGGSYGIKSAAADRTNEEALFKGLEVALDTTKMEYSKKHSNVLLVVGDCGNDDRDTQCLSQDEIIKKMVENNINLLAFQVRRNSETAWLSFTNQMLQMVNKNVNTQYASIGDGSYKASFKQLEDGYDLTNNEGDFFIGSIRYSDPGVDMETSVLTNLLAANIKVFESSVQQRISIIETGGDNLLEIEVARGLSDEEADKTAKMRSDYFEKVLGKANADLIRDSRSLLAFEGYTPKVSEYGNAYWKPILFISREEFEQLMENFARVDESAKSGERKPYVEAVKLLAEKLAGKSAEESGKMTNTEIMNLIAGLNETARSMEGPTMDDLLDPEVVSDTQFKGMIGLFQRQYKRLTQYLRGTNDPFVWNDNGVSYYWIPIEDLP